MKRLSIEACLADRRKATEPEDSLIQLCAEIADNIQRYGDRALARYTSMFDQVDLRSAKISSETLQSIANTANATVCAAIDLAFDNIYRFHEAQQPESIRVETQRGVVCEQIFHPIDAIGIYVPGGTAPLVSTLLMTAIPAMIAGNPTTVLCTPAHPEQRILPEMAYAALKCGVTHVISAGGAQAIAAMAYGTDSIPKVNKIMGPGNRYVTAMKQWISTHTDVAIDMPAGPSEVMIIADAQADAAVVCEDLLAQAEHDTDARAVLISLDDALIEAVQNRIKERMDGHPRQSILEISAAQIVAIRVDSIEDAIRTANSYAPEHLIVNTANAESLKTRFRNCGSVFIGPYAAEALGDYASGTNHTLPTDGYAKSYSGLSVMDYLRSQTVQTVDLQGLRNIGPAVVTLAETERLPSHAESVRIRLERQ